MKEYTRFITQYQVEGGGTEPTAQERLQPGSYWVRIRKIYPIVGTITLWWLAAACMIGVEGGFSKVTMLSAAVRRRAMSPKVRRAVVLNMLHKDWLAEEMTRLVDQSQRKIVPAMWSKK